MRNLRSQIVLIAVAATGAASADRAAAGTVVGVVRFESEYPKAERVRVNTDLETCGTHKLSQSFVVSPDTKGLKNVLVTVEGVSGGKAATPDTEITLKQKGCTYVPHVQVVQLGADGVKLKVDNTDPTLHNIHAYSGRTTLFNVGQPASGRPLSKKLTSPGIVRVRCDVHNWMEAFIVVLEKQPYYALTDENGSFSIEGVPAGSYTLKVWHEAIGEMEKPVAVKATGDAHVDFVISPES